MEMAKQLARGSSLVCTRLQALALVATCAAGLAIGAGGSLLLANENPPCNGEGVVAGPMSGQTIPFNVTCNGVSGCLVREMDYPVYNSGCGGAPAPGSYCSQEADVKGQEKDYVGCTPLGCNETKTTKPITESNFLDFPCPKG